MAVSPRSDGVLELVDLILLSNGVSLPGLLFGLDSFKTFDDGMDVVSDVLKAVECVYAHLCRQLSSIFVQIVRVPHIFYLLVLLPLSVIYGHLHAQALRRFLFLDQRAVLIVAGHEPGVVLIYYVRLRDVYGTWRALDLIMQR